MILYLHLVTYYALENGQGVHCHYNQSLNHLRSTLFSLFHCPFGIVVAGVKLN